MSPRPILKPQPYLSSFSFTSNDSTIPESLTPSLSNTALPFASSRIPPLDSPHVHFPPTPTLTRIEMTHSPFSYDRKPIPVSPNACALPDRGERDVINIEESLEISTTSPECYGGYFPRQPMKSESPGSDMHYLKTSGSVQGTIRSTEAEAQLCLPPSRPRYNRHQTPYHAPPHASQHVNECTLPNTQDPLPQLVFDPSSESESDSCISPPTLDAASSTPGISHISTHFSSGGRGLSQPRFSYLTENCNNPSPRDILIGMTKGIGKKPRTRIHHNGSVTDSIDGVLHRTRSRQTNKVGTIGGINMARECAVQSNFCEPGLDGCLGGF